MVKLLRVSSDWVDKHGMQWSVKKCAILPEPKAEKGSPLELSGQQVENRIEKDYLDTTATATGTSHEKCMKRIKKATTFLHKLRGKGIHHGSMITHSLLWKAYILSATTYGQYLVRHHYELTNGWSTMGNHDSHGDGLLFGDNEANTKDSGQGPDARTTTRSTNVLLQARTRKRETEAIIDGKRKMDPVKLVEAKKYLAYKTMQSMEMVRKGWNIGEKRRKRRARQLSASRSGESIPELRIKPAGCRRAAIQWFSRTFPVIPGSLCMNSRKILSRKISRTKKLMKMNRWTDLEREEAQHVLAELKQALPTK